MYFLQNKFLSQKQVSVAQKLSVTETNSFHRKKIIVTEKIPFKNKSSSQKQVQVLVSVRETHFCHRKIVSVTEKLFCHQPKFLSEKKVDRNLTYKDIVLSNNKNLHNFPKLSTTKNGITEEFFFEPRPPLNNFTTLSKKTKK